jgi:hypothetical protein
MMRPFGALGAAALTLVVMFAGAMLIFAGAGAPFAGAATQAPEITVYKSPSCGCCEGWIGHLRENGFRVRSKNREDMGAIKSRNGVPAALQSRHTAVVGGYVVEGHVPADVIQRLLRERPAVAGLAVPGMPVGVPGTSGARGSYDIVAFDRQGQSRVYARR